VGPGAPLVTVALDKPWMTTDPETHAVYAVW
jgi:hypothetical protein